MSFENKRQYIRRAIYPKIPASFCAEDNGGFIKNLSIGGAAVEYPTEDFKKLKPLTPGQKIILTFGGQAKMPSRIVRVFENGFAAAFDFSTDSTVFRLDQA